MVVGYTPCLVPIFPGLLSIAQEISAQVREICHPEGGHSATGRWSRRLLDGGWGGALTFCWNQLFCNIYIYSSSYIHIMIYIYIYIIYIYIYICIYIYVYIYIYHIYIYFYTPYIYIYIYIYLNKQPNWDDKLMFQADLGWWSPIAGCFSPPMSWWTITGDLWRITIERAHRRLPYFGCVNHVLLGSTKRVDPYPNQPFRSHISIFLGKNLQVIGCVEQLYLVYHF